MQVVNESPMSSLLPPTHRETCKCFLREQRALNQILRLAPWCSSHFGRQTPWACWPQFWLIGLGPSFGVRDHFLGPMEVRVKVKLLSPIRFFATAWTVACEAPPSMGFSRQEYWSGVPFPSPGDLPNPGIKPRSPTLQVDAYHLRVRVWWSVWRSTSLCRRRKSQMLTSSKALPVMWLSVWWAERDSEHGKQVPAAGLSETCVPSFEPLGSSFDGQQSR